MNLDTQDIVTRDGEKGCARCRIGCDQAANVDISYGDDALEGSGDTLVGLEAGKTGDRRLLRLNIRFCNIDRRILARKRIALLIASLLRLQALLHKREMPSRVWDSIFLIPVTLELSEYSL
jgi:hypothetical protein